MEGREPMEGRDLATATLDELEKLAEDVKAEYGRLRAEVDATRSQRKSIKADIDADRERLRVQGINGPDDPQVADIRARRQQLVAEHEMALAQLENRIRNAEELRSGILAELARRNRERSA